MRTIKEMQTVKKRVLLGVLSMSVLGAWAGSMMILMEYGDEIWCEDQYVAMNTIKNELGWSDGPVTIRLDEELALSETFDFSWLDRDITLDLNGNTLKSDEWAEWFSDELINIELQNDHSFTLQGGTVTGAKSKGAVRIAAGQRVTVENVTFENNHCDGNLGDLWEGDVGGAIRCNSNLKLVGCTFRNNSCTTHGGAVGIYSNDYQSRFVIENCTFTGNTAAEAGGALFLGCSGRIQNTIISDNTVTDGDGGGVYLTRHGGVSYGDESEGFWWGRFEGPTLQVEEGVQITGNTAAKAGGKPQASNLYLSRNWNSYENAAVLVSGDVRAETSVGLTLSDGSGVFTRELNEEGGDWINEDFSPWFFADAATLFPLYDADNGCLRLDVRRLAADETAECTADSAEEAAARYVFKISDAVDAVLDEAAKASYTAMFAPVATPVEGKPGTWTVSFALTPAATDTLQKGVDAAPAKLVDAFGKTDTVELDVIPGFYYTIKYGTSLNVNRNAAGTLATGTKLTLKMPSVDGASAFYTVKASPCPIPAQED